MRAATVVQVLQDFEAPRPPTTVANPHIDRSLGSKETHIQSHNRRGDRPFVRRRKRPGVQMGLRAVYPGAGGRVRGRRARIDAELPGRGVTGIGPAVRSALSAGDDVNE